MLSFATPSWSVVSPREWQAKFYPLIARHYNSENPISILISVIMGGGKSVLIDELCAGAQTSDCIVVSTSSQRLTEDLHASISKRCGLAKTVGIWYSGRKRLGQVIVCCNDSLKQLAEKLKELGKVVSLWISDEVHRSETSQILNAYPILSPLNSIGFTATAFRSCPKETISLFKSLLTDENGKTIRYGVSDAIKDGVVVPWKIVNWDGEDKELDESCLEMIKNKTQGSGLVNASTIADAESFAEYLSNMGITSRAIHSQLNLKDQNCILKKLQNNELRCVVHVNILSEGANFPWLRWLCMRRQVGARVRFIQEIGRLLRAFPGKDHAIFLDPHDLFGSFNLSYREALGEALEDETQEPSADPRETAERIANLEPALSLALIESVIRSLVVACDTAGILHARKPIKKEERLAPSNSLQHANMQRTIRSVESLASEGWNACLGQIAKKPHVIRYGFAADMCLALDSITRAQRWPEIGANGEIQGMPEDKDISDLPLVADKHGQFAVDFGAIK